jgi:hypothetical protein
MRYQQLLSRRAWRASLSLLALLGLLALPRAARAGDNLRAELAVFARDIKEILDKNQATSVSVGQFTGPAALATSAGPGIAQRLIAELQLLKIEVRPEASFGVAGKYTDAIDKESDSLGIALYVWVEDRRGEEVYRKGRIVHGDADLVALLGRTLDLPPGGDRKERDAAITESIDKPKVTIADKRVKSNTDSPFAMEVLVGGEVRAPEDRNGLAFVPIQRDEVYAIRLTNNADFEVAVRLSIDGLSMFAFSEVKKDNGEPRYFCLIVPPHKSVIVPGWHISNKQSDSFQVVEFSRSAAASKLIKNSASIGTITAVFAACWEKDKDPPEGEPRVYAKNTRSADATGRGPQVDKGYTEVERAFGADRTSITIRYTKP